MMVVGWIAVVLMAGYAAYLFRCEYYFVRLDKPSSEAGPLPSISVIIPARNEEENIGRLLEDLLAQHLSSEQYEIILVDDQSEDETQARAMAIAGEQPHFRIIVSEAQTTVAYKKAAVAQGIAVATGEMILVTDADCRVGPDWVSTMATYLEDGIGMVSGPVCLESETTFGHFQALEFMGLIAVGAGSIGAETPNMCNGANLAYRKSVFEAVGGFSGIDAIASGDDELLMHKIAYHTPWKIAFAKDPKAIVSTAAHRSWSAFKAQRKRWVSKSTHYERSSITLVLIMSYLAILGIPVLAMASLIEPKLWPFFGVSLGLKVLAEATILRSAALFFDKLPLLKWLLPEQIGHIVYVLWIGLAGNRSSYTWKGRKVK